jgi:hypothetical protein
MPQRSEAYLLGVACSSIMDNAKVRGQKWDWFARWFSIIADGQ